MANRTLSSLALLVVLCAARPEAQLATRPFGTLREQATMQQVIGIDRSTVFCDRRGPKGACDGDEALQETESVLGYESGSARFLGTPASEVVARALGGAR